VDSWCALALLLFSASVIGRSAALGRGRWLALPIAIALIVPLVLRRRAPTAVFVVTAIVALIQWAFAIPLGPGDLAILVALYTVAAHAERRDALAATAIVLLGIVMAATRFHFGEIPGSLLGPAAIALAALILGDDLRTRRAYLAELESRAERLEREREAETRRAVVEERAAIARELHDVVAHNLSVMVIQAEAASYSISEDPAQAQRAMRAVTDTGRQALDEMRRLLEVLRPDVANDARRPQPGLSEIPDLVDGVRQAGLAVELRIQGDPKPVAPGVQLALYRIVQEALTNTLKHAGRGAASAVELRFDLAQISARVSDDGQPSVRPRPGRGQGLVGMRERAAMYDGTLVTGPGPAGGFQVEVRFPVQATR